MKRISLDLRDGSETQTQTRRHLSTPLPIPPTFVMACSATATEVLEFPSIRIVMGLLAFDVFAFPSLENILHIRFVNIDRADWITGDSEGAASTSSSAYIHLHLKQKRKVLESSSATSTLSSGSDDIAVISIPQPTDPVAEATLNRFSTLLSERCDVARRAIIAHLHEAHAVVEGCQMLLQAENQLFASSRHHPSSSAFMYPVMSGVQGSNSQQSYADFDEGMANSNHHPSYLGSRGGVSGVPFGIGGQSQGRPSMSLPVEESVGDFLWGSPESHYPSISVSRVNLSMDASAGFEAGGGGGVATPPIAATTQSHQSGTRYQPPPSLSTQSISDQASMSNGNLASPPTTSFVATPTEFTRHPSGGEIDGEVDGGDVAIVSIVSPFDQHHSTHNPLSCPSSEAELPLQAVLGATCAPEESTIMVDYLRFRAEKDRKAIADAVARLRREKEEQLAAASPANSPLVELVGNTSAFSQPHHLKRNTLAPQQETETDQQQQDVAPTTAVTVSMPTAVSKEDDVSSCVQFTLPHAPVDHHHRQSSFAAAAGASTTSGSAPPLDHQMTMTMSDVLHAADDAVRPHNALVEVTAPPPRSDAFPSSSAEKDDDDPLLALIDQEVSSRTTFWHSRSGQGLLTLLAANSSRITSLELFRVYPATTDNIAGCGAPSSSPAGAGYEDLATGEWMAERYEYDAENRTVQLFLYDTTSLNALLHALIHNQNVASISFDGLFSVSDPFVLRLSEIEMEKAERSVIHTLRFRNCLQMTDNAAGALLNWLRFVREESTVVLKGVLRHVSLKGRVSPWSKTMYDAIMKEALQAATLYAARQTVF